MKRISSNNITGLSKQSSLAWIGGLQIPKYASN